MYKAMTAILYLKGLATLSKNQFLSSRPAESAAGAGAGGAPLAGGAATATAGPLLDRPAHTYSVSPVQNMFKIYYYTQRLSNRLFSMQLA